MTPAQKFEWSTQDRYRSNNGGGALMARILSVADETVTLERWNQRGKTTTRFELPLSYFTSPRCGWKKVKP